VGKSRKKSKKNFQPFGGWEKPLKYAAYRTMMDAAGKDPWKRAGVALGAGRINAGSYYLTKGFQQLSAKKKGQPLPRERVDLYAATGAAMGLGLLEDSDDLFDLAMELDSMGAFDPPGWSPDDGTPVPRQRNQYAWRLNCEDGVAYGVSPYDYPTKTAYLAALETAKRGAAVTVDTNKKPVESMQEFDVEIDSEKTFLFCKVSRLDNGRTEYFLIEKPTVQIGQTVVIPTSDGETTKGIVLSIEEHTMKTAPKDPYATAKLITEKHNI